MLFESEHLIIWGFPRQETGADKFLAGYRQFRSGETDVSAQGGLRVIADTVGIGHGDQKQVERPGAARATRQQPVTDQAVVDPYGGGDFYALRGTLRVVSGTIRHPSLTLCRRLLLLGATPFYEVPMGEWNPN
jgi:hypothetical protein